MNTNYYEEFLPDLAEFKEKLSLFDQGQIPVAEYKGFSGAYGSYAQRGARRHMLRLRMAGGRLTKERLRFICDAIDKYGVDTLKITTCQTIQMHNLKAADLSDMIEDAWKASMLTRGGGGDFPRNVMMTPLSGVREGEAFDVAPYAEAMGQYLFRYIKTKKFPRKLKVCFCNHDANEVHATFRDLGFVAREDGCFDVYAAGGLGRSPRLGLQVGEAVAPSDILYYAKAMVETFCAYGNYENRGKARTRFMQESLGEEGLVVAFKEKLAEAMAGEDLSLLIEPVFTGKCGDYTEIIADRAIPQKQDGLYAVFYQPVGGLLAPEKAKELYAAIRKMKDVEIRLTPDEGLYVINLTAGEAERILSITADSAKTAFDRSVACIGAAICQVGLRDSQAALRKVLDEVRPYDFADGVLPQVRFSGCPSSCSAHQCSAIGFRGAVKQTPEGPKEAFALFLGGCQTQDKEILSMDGPAIATEDIGSFFIELGQMITEAGVQYEEWLATHADEFDALVQKYV